MATQSQIEANRNNAKQSTGPRTNQGKQRSSQNALKHGLRAEQSVIPGENAADYDNLLTEFDDTFHPNTAYERALVRQMADAEWRLQRISRIEAAFLSYAIKNNWRHYKEYDEPADPKLDDTCLLGKIMQNRTAEMNHFARYEANQSRGFHRAYRQLIEVRELEARDKRRNYQQAHRDDHKPSHDTARDSDERYWPAQSPDPPPWANDETAEQTQSRLTSISTTTSNPNRAVTVRERSRANPPPASKPAV